jgi:hypothetical protein
MERKLFAEEHGIFRDAFRRFLARGVSPHLEHWGAGEEEFSSPLVFDRDA